MEKQKLYSVSLEKGIHLHLNKSTMILTFLKTMNLSSATLEAASSLR